MYVLCTYSFFYGTFTRLSTNSLHYQRVDEQHISHGRLGPRLSQWTVVLRTHYGRKGTKEREEKPDRMCWKFKKIEVMLSVRIFLNYSQASDHSNFVKLAHLINAVHFLVIIIIIIITKIIIIVIIIIIMCITACLRHSSLT